jgi:hypothetical protein
MTDMRPDLGGLDQAHTEGDESGADQDRSGSCESCAGRGPTGLADGQVQEEASGSREHPGEESAAGNPFESFGEVGAWQVEQVDEGEHEEHARVRMSGSEEPFLPVGQICAATASTAGEEAEQRPAAGFDGDERQHGDDGKDVCGLQSSPFGRFSGRCASRYAASVAELRELAAENELHGAGFATGSSGSTAACGV